MNLWKKINIKWSIYLQPNVPWDFKTNKKTPQFSAEKSFLTVQKWKLRMNIPINLEEKDFSRQKRWWIMYPLLQEQIFWYVLYMLTHKMSYTYTVYVYYIFIKQCPSGKKKSS